MKLFITFLLCVLLFACGQNSPESVGKSIEEPLIQLNNNSPWEANEATTIGVHKMKQAVQQFEITDNSDDFLSLKSQLEVNFAEIIKNCTMKGEAHDRLHDYLMPLKDYMQQLESDDEEKRLKTIQQLKIHLEAYDKFFI
ncbi:MAG TPA: hypothetical protein VFD80_05875 [Flavobacteriaceae bacterium]|nr:hypothetical protein [Flavobacteriaceae bacterium]